jgi:NAD(P)-dependent dehydrogenase (short-subunit alcohol dehydrogenase family)
MPRIRQQNVLAAQWAPNGGALGAPDLTLPDNQVFGANVFSPAVQRQRLPTDVFNRLQDTLARGEALDTSLADAVALAMKEWALEKGATHFTHWFQPLHEIDVERVDGMVRTNVLGVIYGMRAAGEQMMRQRQGGGIVNVSSIVGEFPDPGSGAYAASKAAVDILSRTGYRELRDQGIHVVNVKPALTDTRFSSVARGTIGRMGGDSPEKVARWVVDALEGGSATAGYR